MHRPVVFRGHGTTNLLCGQMNLLSGVGHPELDSDRSPCNLSHPFLTVWSQAEDEAWWRRHGGSHPRLDNSQVLSVAVTSLFSTLALVVTPERVLDEAIRDGLKLLPYGLWFEDQRGMEEKALKIARVVSRNSQLDVWRRQMAYASRPIRNPAYFLELLSKGELGFDEPGRKYMLCFS